jgi:hypothetical protein
MRTGKASMLQRWIKTAALLAFGYAATSTTVSAQVMTVPQGSVAPIGTAGSGVSPFQGVEGSEVSDGANRVYGNLSWLFWKVPSKELKFPLATTNNVGGFGLPSETGTTFLPISNPKLKDYTPGFRYDLGVWFDDNRDSGSDLSFFFMMSQTRVNQIQSSPTNDILIARPFNDLLFVGEDARLLAFPGSSSGGIRVESYFRMWGVDLNPYVCRIAGDNVTGLHLSTGFKYLYINDATRIIDKTTAIGGSQVSFLGTPFGNSSTSVRDEVFAANRFYGGSVGLKWRADTERFSFMLGGKFALGGNQTVVDMYGQSSLIGADGKVQRAVPGGFYIQNSNAGKFSSYRLAILPEVETALSFKVTNYLSIFATYNFMWLSTSVRAADQLVDRNLNSGQIPTSPNFGLSGGRTGPSRFIERGDFNAQALGLGLTLSY